LPDPVKLLQISVVSLVVGGDLAENLPVVLARRISDDGCREPTCFQKSVKEFDQPGVNRSRSAITCSNS